MRADDIRPNEILRYGAYLCLNVPDALRQTALGASVPALAKRFGLTNEFEAREGHPPNAVAFLRRISAIPADIDDDELLGANALVHVASATEATVKKFCDELTDLLGAEIDTQLLSGVVRPTNYTGNAMHNFAYADQLAQQSGSLAPNAFLVPMSKTSDWWEKDWMEHHTYFLPRYDKGTMVNEGHALAAAAGVSCLMRRTYKSEIHPAPEGMYDFVNYFECADTDVPTFHDVCSSLRDTTKNPEWKFVREGPMWHGRRVATWPELFS